MRLNKIVGVVSDIHTSDSISCWPNLIFDFSIFTNIRKYYLYSSLYYVRCWMMTDNIIIYNIHKMKRSKMYKIRISTGYSKKKYAYAFFFHVCSSRDSVHKSFNAFDSCEQLLFQVKVLQERFNSWHVFPTSLR